MNKTFSNTVYSPCFDNEETKESYQIKLMAMFNHFIRNRFFDTDYGGLGQKLLSREHPDEIKLRIYLRYDEINNIPESFCLEGIDE